MARCRTHHLGLVVLLVAAGIGIGVAGDAVAGRPESRSRRQPAAASFTPTALEAAVVPGRTQSGAGIGARQAPGRSLVALVAALFAVAALVVLIAARSVPPVASHRALVARRHFIALRAPPSPRLA